MNVDMHRRWARRRGERGLAWLEVLVALSALLPLAFLIVSVFRSGAGLDARAASFGAQRGQLAELNARWENEAASAWAMFTPASDVLGSPNCSGAACNEVDFFMRDAAGSAHFWAWRFDPAARTLQRYTYAAPGAPPAGLATSGPASTGIVLFEAHRLAASALTTPPLRGYAVKDVALNFGYPSVDGGNALTVIEVANAAGRTLREFLPHVTPTGFDIVVGTFTPPPALPSGPGSPNPCDLSLGSSGSAGPPAPPTCTGFCRSCAQTGPPERIYTGSAPCDGKEGWGRWDELPSFVKQYTFWSPDGSTWQFFSESTIATFEASTSSGACTTWYAATSTTTVYWDRTTS